MFDRFQPRRGFPIEHGWGGPEWVHVVFMAVVFAALIAFVVWLVAAIRRDHAHAMPMAAPVTATPRAAASDPAVVEARMRYARGELTREQFLQIAADLGEPHDTSSPGTSA